MFMESQGYKITENMFEQDNESAIKFEKNGLTFAGPKSRHINIRYFWLKDRIRAKGITVRHCPTLQMLADFLPNYCRPFLFKKFRAVVLGHAHIDTLNAAIAEPIEKRVGKGQPSTRDTSLQAYGTVAHGTKYASWSDVVKRKVRDEVKMHLSNPNNVSRDHSLKTIPLNSCKV
jgi:hypothetical protein